METIRNIGKAVGQTLFGTGLEKPVFELDNKSKDEPYEVRHYSAARWVSTDVIAMEHRDAGRIGFRKLFNYIQGKNETGTKVDMTAPVTVKVLPGEGPNCENTFKVSFYVPQIHQEKPPLPSNPEVYISDEPAKTVFVRSFDGFASDEQWIKEAQNLLKSLEGKERRVDTSYFYTAGYDSPFKMVNRHNEVWFVQQTD